MRGAFRRLRAWLNRLTTTQLAVGIAVLSALALTFLQRYYKKAGIGTLMSLTLPYAVAMLVGWYLFFALWWMIGLPLGPGTPMDYPAA